MSVFAEWHCKRARFLPLYGLLPPHVAARRALLSPLRICLPPPLPLARGVGQALSRRALVMAPPAASPCVVCALAGYLFRPAAGVTALSGPLRTFRPPATYARSSHFSSSHVHSVVGAGLPLL
ncbi:hypothetical protein ABB37_05832 [Leptomonas pyrrhocoris]|uniref:Uncharacterized protein n=1 Tax=Leptomonas pyrrhocoris TaxID=157538 RepID=A0A0M9FYV7_LEPPY|nr:hypothetical protein ABB37_05824 [Leptomonas pyrrhocoris]XP_015657135.1 hypothetical protein ABB37_05832 [Leptomonas pyrrhocoris]XP_015657136.1 hypothetical protein ABB37_05832 [Leptomonas pyrrhocoris]KPA78687.1 hypothetical protein ABB37_05824 [Leptomonas pyrrhocoris]KPA78696.1 hypothetical protein ABB37_05832 [Leptomonas pyrrhocoris]KPA78697.1 hypothetical protein ABB37_05832 [Leptomonas pyrrhocoris]|eukprot:XP_015657126.1 hypothetical protein ABB37_05824 [Leptomonas pyrrhocoris]